MRARSTAWPRLAGLLEIKITPSGAHIVRPHTLGLGFLLLPSRSLDRSRPRDYERIAKAGLGGFEYFGFRVNGSAYRLLSSLHPFVHAARRLYDLCPRIHPYCRCEATHRYYCSRPIYLRTEP